MSTSMNGLLLLLVHSLWHLGAGVATIQTIDMMRVLVGAAKVRVLPRARSDVKLDARSVAAFLAEVNATSCASLRVHWILQRSRTRLSCLLGRGFVLLRHLLLDDATRNLVAEGRMLEVDIVTHIKNSRSNPEGFVSFLPQKS